MIMKNEKQIGFIYKNNKKIDKIIKNGKVYFEQGFTREQTSNILPISFNGIGKDLKDYKIYGNSYQNDIPTPLNPVEVISCGDKTYNLYNYKRENLNSNVKDLLLNFDEANNYLIINGSNSTSSYQRAINNIDITDILEDGETYTIYQEDISASQTTSSFSKCEIRVVKIDSNNVSSYFRTWGKHTKTFVVNKTTYPKYEIDIVLPQKGDVYNNYRNRFMLLKGSYSDNNFPSYEHYGYKIPININNNIKNIYLEQPLRKVGAYSDYIDFKNQKIIRETQELILNGSEHWAIYNENVYYMGSSITNGWRDIKTICNYFNDMTYLKTHNHLQTKPSQSFKEQYPTVAAFKEWLSTHNLHVIGAYETPKEEDFILPTLPSTNGNNILNIETEIVPSQTYIKYKSNK